MVFVVKKVLNIKEKIEPVASTIEIVSSKNV